MSLADRFGHIRKGKILVVGDLLLDTYTLGKAGRISPEAPVAVIQVTKEEKRPGGAGNVACNLISLGAEVSVLGRCGTDTGGDALKELLENEEIETEGLFIEEGYTTPVKNRIIANNQQIVRVDHETLSPLPASIEDVIIESLPSLLEGVDLIAISDYGKGFCTPKLLQSLIKSAGERPIITDPKGLDFSRYSGTTLLKPNLKEAYAAANLPPEASLNEVAERILKQVGAEALMITRSEAGISLFYRDGNREDYPVKVKEIIDVTGAGDTVLAVLAFIMASGLSIGEATALANIAAGIAIERFGCARVTLAEIARRLLENDIRNKVFDTPHLFALQAALKGRPYVLVNVSESEGLTPELFKRIQSVGMLRGCDLLLYIEEENPTESFVEMLASLQPVSFIIIHQATLDRFIELTTQTEQHNYVST